MIIIPERPEPPPQTPYSRELARRIEQQVRDYKREHPDLTADEVRAALMQSTPAEDSTNFMRRDGVEFRQRCRHQLRLEDRWRLCWRPGCDPCRHQDRAEDLNPRYAEFLSSLLVGGRGYQYPRRQRRPDLLCRRADLDGERAVERGAVRQRDFNPGPQP